MTLPTLAYQAGLVCPQCRGELTTGPEAWACAACDVRFGLEEGIPNFVVGDRFPDGDKRELLEYEERANRACAAAYYAPLIAQLTQGTPRERVRVLSVGCGTGVDVEVLTEAGFDAVGLDCGYRNAVWPRRRWPERLLLANGQHPPFREGWFDVAIMGCVFPHVGVVGDSHRVAPTVQADRRALARDVASIVRRGGHIIVSSPNRWFPWDLFHRKDFRRRIPRPNLPTDPFLLSLGDYRDLFVGGADCERVTPLSIVSYWGFVNMDTTPRTRALRALLRGWFWMVSVVGWLRASPLAPWLCVHVVR